MALDVGREAKPAPKRGTKQEEDENEYREILGGEKEKVN